MARNKVETQFYVVRVKDVFCVHAIIFAAFVLASCSSSESGTNAMAVNRPPTNVPNVNVANVATANFNGANSFNANANQMINSQTTQIDEGANRAGQRTPSMNSRPAPEDSTMTATLTDFPRETRTWKNHPVLLKIEKTHNGGDGTIKVHLRNGKVIDLAGSSILQIDQIPAALVLELAGARSPAERTGSRRPPKN